MPIIYNRQRFCFDMASIELNDVKKALEKSSGITTFNISTMAEYFAIVDSVTRIWRDKIDFRQFHDPTSKKKPPLFPGELAPWFRGTSSDVHNLSPSLERFRSVAFNDPKFRDLLDIREPYPDPKETALLKEIEVYLLQRFKTFGSPLIGDKLPENEISWHFVLRHHSAPSRLLDWSKGSLVALHFAIAKHFCNQLKTTTIPVASWAAVWMLEPRRLVEMSTEERRIPGSTNIRDERLIESYLGIKESRMVDNNEPGTEISETPGYPLPIIPNLISPRIRSHIGRFTLHSNNNLGKAHGGLLKFAEDAFKRDNLSYLVKIRIDLSNIRSLGESLRTTGIADNNFSQDLDGLTDELINRVHLGNRLSSDKNLFVPEHQFEDEQFS